jgi:hypothetical protein
MPCFALLKEKVSPKSEPNRAWNGRSDSSP